MIINGWSIALLIICLAVLFLLLLASATGLKVIRYWDHGSDSAKQIKLENSIWLSSALLEYGFAFQIFSLVLLILAADAFSSLLVGAMCATGAFVANGYGIPALLSKLALIFFSGYWLLLHRLDLQSESYPLVKLKYWYLLLLIPLLVVDALLLLFYLLGLEPDVITSCCGVLFATSDNDGFNLLGPLFLPGLLTLFYGLALFLVVAGLRLYSRLKSGPADGPRWLILTYGLSWYLFLGVSLVMITTFFSSYIYAMPSHRCPFDILQPEYGYIGYPIYASLMIGSFFGTGTLVAALVADRDGLRQPVIRFQRAAVPLSMVLLIAFLLITAYAPLSYMLAGGEI